MSASRVRMKGRAVYGVDTGTALLFGSILAGVSVFLFVLRRGGSSSVPAGTEGTLWIGGAALAAILALGFRSRIEIDFEKGRWKTTRGLWPFWTLMEGSLSEVGGLALTYFKGARTGSIWTVELERSETSYRVGRFYEEAPARACWERTADELGAPAWDRTEDPPRYRERTSAISAAVAPAALEPESAAHFDPPPPHVRVSGDPGGEPVLRPVEPIRPPGPLPSRLVRSIFFSAAILRASGDALTR